jgi:hypothetical protein
MRAAVLRDAARFAPDELGCLVAAFLDPGDDGEEEETGAGDAGSSAAIIGFDERSEGGAP